LEFNVPVQHKYGYIRDDRTMYKHTNSSREILLDGTHQRRLLSTATRLHGILSTVSCSVCDRRGDPRVDDDVAVRGQTNTPI